MKFSLVFFLFLWIGVYQLHAQSITIEKAPSILCFGSDIDVTVKITGTFSSTNQFSIGIEYGTYEYSEFPAQLINPTTLRIRLSQNAFSNLKSYVSFRLRAVSSAPTFISNWSDYGGSAAFPLLFLGEHSLQLNRYGQVSIPYMASDHMTITLQDSISRDTLQFRFYNNDYDLFNKLGRQKLTFDKPVSYYVKSIQNTCGVSTGKGFIRVKINPISIYPSLITPLAVCEGSTAYVSFNKEGGNWATGNVFKIRLIPEQNFEEEMPNLYIDTEATLENGTLKFIVPALAGKSPTSHYSIRILSSNPITISPFSNLWLTVAPSPTAELYTMNSTSIPYGTGMYFSAYIKGIPAYRINLSDGSQVVNEDYYSLKTENSFLVKHTGPLYQNQTYSLSSVQTGCGAAKIQGNPLNITVTKGVVADSIPSKEACEGQVYRFRIKSNYNLDGPVKVRFNINPGTGLPSHVIQGTVSQNWVSFIPNSFLDSYKQEVRYVAVSLDFGDYQSPELFKMPIHGKPSARFRNDSKSITLKVPEVYNLSFVTFGSPDNRVTFSDGSQSDNSNTGVQSFFMQKTSTYSIVKVENVCYSTTLKDDCLVTVEQSNEQGIILKKPHLFACHDQKLTIDFDTFGDFKPGNVFKIQYSADYSDYPTYKEFEAGTVSKGGTYSLTFPDEFLQKGGISVRIISTSPAKTSQSFPISNAGKIALLSENFTREIDAGHTVNYRPYLKNAYPPLSMVISDGKNDKTYTNDVYNSLYADLTPYKSTTYQLKSISNICGTVSLPNTMFKVTVYTQDSLRVSWPRHLRSTYYQKSPCFQGKIRLPFLIRGTSNANTTFTLQVSARERHDAPMNFVDVAQSRQADYFDFEWPYNSTASFLAFRIMVSNPGTYSDTLLFNSLIPPQVTLASQNHLVSPGQNITLDVTYKNSNYGQIYWSDGVVTSGSREVTVQKGNTYKILSVSNECGYGIASGQVSVRVKPSLSLNALSTYEICQGNTLKVGYSILGDYESSNHFVLSLIDIHTRKAIRLDSAASGSSPFTLSISHNFTPGIYTLEISSTHPVIRASTIIYIQAIPDYRLVGSTTINAGQSATLQFLSPVQTGELVSYTLSDNSAGLFYSSSTYAFVKPSQTTTYTIKEISNSCGKGRGMGSATVIVNPATERSISVVNAANAYNYGQICSGDTLYISYTTSGSFSANNRFSVQMSDSTGTNFKTVNAISWGNQQFKVPIAENFPKASAYRVMVVASDPNTSSAASPIPLAVYSKPTARLLSQTAYALPGQRLSVPIELTGDPTWYVVLKNEFSSLSFNLQLPVDTLKFDREGESMVYKLSSVVNNCGLGRIIEPSQLRIELVTSVENPVSTAIEVFPNPVTERIRIKVGQRGNYRIQLYNISGSLLSEEYFDESIYDMDVRPLPVGTYLLRFIDKDRSQTFRIIKD
ncbi:T9SS type A sorting domain-containing protein [Siphonobacter sp. SORGH_AS_1065]|uniref:T9SS type A sorting domain-containing protein n=1 Tax=Siphonobacter sp. SORGH_AS_1065 TaxID=3041795 RepID=UPI0027886FB2|nr:T9SS type A sorting domain-containing protein [Siphonobacter sp. SORGH_AS_1065]MDQ1089961.1 hypothetical protein [Siphonobacter sp. SORGH_AS_1065]